MMLYPRENSTGMLVTAEQMVGYREHLVNEHRVVFLSGAITGDVEPHNQLLALDSLAHDPIHLVITSPGGDLDATFLFYDTIKLIKSPVETLGRFCASAAVLILAAGNKRYLLSHSRVMLHLPENYFQRDTLIPVQEMGTIAREAQKFKDRMVDILVECGATKTHDEILADIDRDFWLEPEEAIAYGLADKVMEPKDLERWLK